MEIRWTFFSEKGSQPAHSQTRLTGVSPSCELNAWIAKDAENNPEGEGLKGDVGNLGGVNEWMLQGVEKDLVEDLDEEDDEDEEGNDGNV